MIIYIHHRYTYELFWYFFHGVNVDNVPTWTSENRYNKNTKITNDITINFTYRDEEFKAIFCSDRLWDMNDGYHVFEYMIHNLENDKLGDRGWNNDLFLGLNTQLDKINNYASNLGDRVSLFFIDWEVSSTKEIDVLTKRLNPYIDVFLDELLLITPSQQISFTHILYSYLMPDTIKLRDYYFLADYLKYKNDYKYKISYPIRRITFDKFRIAESLHNLNNDDINITLSSFTGTVDDDRVDSNKIKLKNDLINLIGESNIIQKRGYNLDDFGGEWNDNNMNEFMWKLLDTSDVNIVYERSIGKSINEKILSHILVGKPFIPTHSVVLNFYNEFLENYGYDVIEYPLKFEKITDILGELNSYLNDDLLWNGLVNELTEYVNNLRKTIFEILENNNGYLDFIISKKKYKKSKDII